MSDELAAIRERDDCWEGPDRGEPLRWRTKPGQLMVDRDVEFAVTLADRRTLLALLDTEREARASAEAAVAALRTAAEALDKVRWEEGAELGGLASQYNAVYRLHAPLNALDAVLADTRAAAEAHDAAIRREAAREYRAELRAWVKSNAVSAAYTFGGALVVDHDALDTLLAEPSDA